MKANDAASAIVVTIAAMVRRYLGAASEPRQRRRRPGSSAIQASPMSRSRNRILRQTPSQGANRYGGVLAARELRIGLSCDDHFSASVTVNSKRRLSRADPEQHAAVPECPCACRPPVPRLLGLM